MDIKKIDWIIFLLLILLMISGVIAIYSASTSKIGDEFLTRNFYLKQLIWVFISLLFLFVLLKLPMPVIDLMIIPVYIITVIFLILVLFLPEIKGSHRWIFLGPVNFQPSELAKLVTILFVAKLISKPYITEWQILLRSFAVVLLPVILILLEPDLGTALTLMISLFAMLLFSGLPVFFLILIISPVLSIITSFSLPVFLIYILILLFLLYKTRLSLVAIGFAGVLNAFIFFITPVIWNGLKTYQQNRILSFIDPMRDPLGAGYQIIQSKIAIGSGNIFGKGFLMGTQKNLNFLPEHHTDFIFSVIGEEFGFFGCLIILVLFFVFLMRMMKGINKLKRPGMKYAGMGILSYLTFQVFVNIGMNIGIVPTTGIPLPFISYGGSNLLINVISVGFILKYLKERSIFE